ncbi:MAG: class I SAM-dependent rRNA methyltransferase [Sphaerochaetaceae bacterium]
MDYTEKDFGKILKQNALKMRRLMLQSGTTCMRGYDRNLERFPVTVELYGPYARVTDYSDAGLEEEDERVCCDIVSRMLYVQASHVVFHRRPKREGKEQHRLQSEQSLEVQVSENGLLFTVDLTKRIDTGLFLDHMLTRKMVEEMSRGSKVLNLFSYTGSFSVYAARGGAVRVESVDLSSTYTAWAEKNLADNGYPSVLFPCIAADAWSYLRDVYAQGKKYDLIIFDPPSFSNSRKMDHDFDVQRDYPRWMNVLNALLTMDGKLVFSTNLGTFRMDEKAIRGFEIKEITRQVAAPGFTRRLGTARTWLLTKHEEIRIPERWKISVQEKAGKDQHDENGQEARSTKKEEKRMKEKKKEPEVLETEEKIEVEEANTVEAEPNQTADDAIVFSHDETEEVSEDLGEEGTEEDQIDENQAPVEEANEVEDDLLTLRWDENDFAPLMQDSTQDTSAQNPVGEDYKPRTGEHHDDTRREGNRSSYRDRDNRRDSRPSYRDRDDRRDSRPSYRDRDDRRDSRPSYQDRDDRRGGRSPFSDDKRGGRFGDSCEERRQRKSGPKPYGFDSFRQTRTRGEHEDDPFFSE